MTVDEARAILADASCGLDALNADGLARADAAAWLLLRYYLSRIANGEVDPDAGLEAVEAEVRRPYLVHLRAWQYACQSHDYHHLYGLYDAYSDLTSRPHEVTWDGMYGETALVGWGRAVVAEARAWLQRLTESGSASSTQPS